MKENSFNINLNFDNSMNIIDAISNKISDGHFTIMKFTTNWRGCYGTPDCWEDVQKMIVAKNKEELVLRMIVDGLDKYKFENKLL